MWKYVSVFKCKQSLLGGYRHIVSFDLFDAFENPSCSWLVKEVSQIKQTLAGPLSSVWVGAVLQQHLVKAALQQSSAAGAQCSTLTTPCRNTAKLWPGRFLVLEDLADVEPTRRWRWWDCFASAFHGRCSVPFQADTLGWQHKLFSLLVCRNLGFKILL